MQHATPERFFAAVVVAIVFALAACGGEGPSAASTESFKNDFVGATSSYKQRTETLKQEAQGALGQGTPKLVAVYESMLNTVKQAHAEFKTLKPPSAIATEFDQLVDNLGEQERALQQLVGSVKEKDDARLTASFQSLATLLADFAKVHERIQQQLK